MAANHRIIEIGKSPDGTFHYHLKKGRNVLLSAAGYNEKKTIVNVTGHLFNLSEEWKKSLGHYNRLDLDGPRLAAPARVPRHEKPMPITRMPPLTSTQATGAQATPGVTVEDE